MGSPLGALPHTITEDAIQALLLCRGLPPATAIAHLEVTAQYHAVYFITLPASEASFGQSELVLRVSGRQLPTMKTENEIGVMTWLAKYTKIPIPKLLAYDASEDNPLGYEYTLLSRIRGVPLSDVCDMLADSQMLRILDQLIDFLVQLHSYSWDAIGGLSLKDNNEPVLAQIVDETFWQSADATQFWPTGETVMSLNIRGPYSSYVAYITAQVQQYVRLIGLHDSLAFMRDIVPRLQAFVATLPQFADELNCVALRLAHKDLHFANVMCDPMTGDITGLLDWEFSGVVPFTKWNPRRSFLWNGREDESALPEKQRLIRRFEARCAERNVSFLEDARFTSSLQENMQVVADFLRAIVEVCPRGQQRHLVQGWKAIVLENLESFGV